MPQITLCNNSEYEKAKEHFMAFERIFQVRPPTARAGRAARPRPRPAGQELDSETKNADPKVLEQRQTLSHVLLLDAPANDTSDDTGDK